MVIQRVSRLKQRAFVLPGECITLEARWLGEENGTAGVALLARSGERKIAVARITLSAAGTA